MHCILTISRRASSYFLKIGIIEFATEVVMYVSGVVQ